MNDFREISNSTLSAMIDEWVKGERDRKIMKRRLIDRIKFEPLAEEFELSEKIVRNIVKKNSDLLEKVSKQP